MPTPEIRKQQPGISIPIIIIVVIFIEFVEGIFLHATKKHEQHGLKFLKGGRRVVVRVTVSSLVSSLYLAF